MRRRGLGFLLVLVFGCFASAGPRAKPNVVVFFTDDQGTLDAGCYGSKDLLTPTIDKLARTGVRLRLRRRVGARARVERLPVGRRHDRLLPRRLARRLRAGGCGV